ncbi:cupin domain-containing protein [Bradyrhizobium sp. Leo170]|nr:cupin domain-containing protein [Bradyrhizobium sp. Leo170]
MGLLGRVPALTLIAVIALSVTSDKFAKAQQPTIKRTDLLKTDLAGMEGKEMNIWTAALTPGAQTGKHHHPTPRFVVVLEGSVVVEMEGKPPQIFKAGQAFQEPPDVVHNFRNASTTEPAKAIGIQYAGKGQPLQVDDH